MGVDISHIVRHDFRGVENEEKSKKFVEKTIATLKKNLLIQNVDDCFEYRHDCEFGETTFRLPIYDVEFTLHNGFWLIEPFCHYCQIAMHDNGYFRLRQLIFDIAKALGKDEAWHAEEFYTWNGNACAAPETTFEQWKERVTKMYGKPIPEFDQTEIMAHFPDYEPIYHDRFKECKELYDNIQSKIDGYRLLGLYDTGNCYLRCEREGQLFLINEKTLRPMFDEPIEAMLQSLNGPEFIIKKNGLSAVFDMDGNQLTDFVEGVFDWEWAPSNLLKPEPTRRIIYNKEAGIKLAPK